MKYPSILRLIEIDYYAYLAITLPAGFWLVMLLLTLVQSQSLDRALPIGYALTALGLVVLAWRFMQTSRLLSSGKEVNGNVQRTWFFRDRARITCSYVFQGQKYHTSLAVRFSRRVMSIKVGERVRLILDSKNPRKYLIRQLFE